MGKSTGGPAGGGGGGAPAKTPARGRVEPAAAAEPAKTPKTPVGVVVVESQQEASGSVEMHKLLRQPRYFDDDFEGTALRCFRCGGTGHMSRDCRNEIRQKPCILCAQFGHMRNECPQALCFKCKRPGHQSRDCPNAGGRQSQRDRPCLRCGSKSCPCANRSDYIRADGGCTTKYHHADLALVRCHVCLAHGHLTCRHPPKSVPKASCYNCGDSKHLGPECWREVPAAIRGEQADIAREEDAAYWKAAQGQLDPGGYSMARGSRGAYGGDSGREVWYESPEGRGRSTYEQGRYAWEQKMGYHSGGGGGGHHSRDRERGQDREQSGKRRSRDHRDSREESRGKHTRFF